VYLISSSRHNINLNPLYFRLV